MTIKVSVFMAMSLDGYIARTDGDVNWLHEGDPLPDGDDAGYSEFFASVDALIMGRGSFEKVLTFDPFPYGDKPIMVISHSLQTVPEALQETVSIHALSPQEVIKEAQKRGYQHIYLDGGKLVQSFIREGLVDEMTVTIIPILIGQGLPFFGELSNDIKLEHVRTQTWDNGFVQSIYKIKK